MEEAIRMASSPHCGDGGLANAANNISNAGGSVHSTANAMGGTGGSAGRGGIGGNGGTAMSDAQGITTGDFAAEVSSSATGGAGGHIIGNGFPISFTGGNGGDAFAAATGSNNGLNAVNVSSIRHWRRCMPESVGLGGTDGDKRRCHGDLHSLRARRQSIRDRHRQQVITLVLIRSSRLMLTIGGAALAHASATGQSGNATATANTGGGIFTAIQASAAAPVGSTASVESRARIGGAAPTLAMASGLQSAAFVTGLPSGLSVTAAIVQGASYPGNGSGIPETFNSEVDLSIDLTQIANVGNLQIHLTDSASSGNGFDSLTFQIYKEGSVVESDVFANLALATAFFTDHTLDFGPAGSGVTGSLDLRFVFSLTGSGPGNGFIGAFTVDVPEPTIAGLFVCGVAVIIFSHRKRMRR